MTETKKKTCCIFKALSSCEPLHRHKCNSFHIQLTVALTALNTVVQYVVVISTVCSPLGSRTTHKELPTIAVTGILEVHMTG